MNKILFKEEQKFGSMSLYFMNGKKVLIGTQRGDALLRAMKKMMENN